MFSLFKFDKINCQFSTGGVPSCQTPRKGYGTYYCEENNYNPQYIEPYLKQFSEGYILYEICVTVKPEFLQPPQEVNGLRVPSKSKTHFNIYQLIYKKIIAFLKKYKLHKTEILLLTEYSPKGNRLHFHGCINRYFSPEMAGYLDSWLKKYIGITKTNRIQSKNYFDYMTKDAHNVYYSIPNCMICKL